MAHPRTFGKLVMKTTSGDLEIELWPKEAPKACRNFVQLALEGYYDQTPFHRIVTDFIVQGGDTSTNFENGLEGSAYDNQPFQTEVHSRLTFHVRGLLAMANPQRNQNLSQFFFTLCPAPSLTGQHTLFGKVVGDTMFNLMRIGEMGSSTGDVTGEGCTVLSISVEDNPFADIVPRSLRVEREAALREKLTTSLKETRSGSRSKGHKNLSLLSFGEDEADDSVELLPASKKFSKSAHELLKNDPTLSSEPVLAVSGLKRSRDAEEPKNDGDLSRVKRVLEASKSKATAFTTLRETPTGEIHAVRKQIADMKAKLKAGPVTDEPLEAPAPPPITYLSQELSKYKSRSESRGLKESDLLGKLATFREKLFARPPSPPLAKSKPAASDTDLCALHRIPDCESCRSAQLEEEASLEVDRDLSWMGHELKFDPEKGKKGGFKVEDYRVIDPRDDPSRVQSDDRSKKKTVRR